MSNIKNIKFLNLVLSKYPTQTAFAKELGWSRQKLNKVILKQKKPSINDIKLFSKILDKNTDDLIDIFL